MDEKLIPCNDKCGLATQGKPCSQPCSNGAVKHIDSDSIWVLRFNFNYI